MKPIQTICGPIHSLGYCQMHEHTFVAPTPAARENPALCINDVQLSGQELQTYAAAGGQSLLDAQPGRAGRDAQVLARIAAQSGVNIVAVTGYHLPKFYTEDDFILTAEENALHNFFMEELTQGMYAHPSAGGGQLHGCRAGAVKAALGERAPTGHALVRLRAAAKAAAEADVPLILHTECGQNAVRAIAVCAGQGLAPKRIAVCHADRQAQNFAPHEEIAATGAYLEYDTIGRFKYHSDEAEVVLLQHMLGRGYQNRLLLSLDTTRQRLKSYGGEIGLTYLIDSFLPRLRAAGIEEDTLHALTVQNPQSIFTA